jgi:hypothetical protein
MYFLKESRSGLKWTAELWEKQWSEELSSYTTNLITKKDFWYWNGSLFWARKYFFNLMINNGELTIRRKDEQG